MVYRENRSPGLEWRVQVVSYHIVFYERGMSSISKACLELSNSIKGLRLSRSQPPEPTVTGPGNVNPTTTTTRTGSTASTVSSTISRALRNATSRMKAFDRNGQTVVTPASKKPILLPWEDERFLNKFFYYFSLLVFNCNLSPFIITFSIHFSYNLVCIIT